MAKNMERLGMYQISYEDLKKNVYFQELGYTVIRIKANDIGSFDKGLKQILRIREIKDNITTVL